jgi:hypothetical protein
MEPAIPAEEKPMNAITGTWKNGQIIPDNPVDWPEGCRLVIEPVPASSEKIGLDESEWGDDAASLARWDAWLKTIEPLELSEGERKAQAEFEEKMRQYNLEAVRRQMEEGPLP